MDAALIIVLALGAALLGACPFSLLIGKLALHKDIRKYGDGNPGAYNVFRTGSVFWGIIALITDIIKGMPFILIARLVFGITQPFLYIIALCAVIGHAFSPFLGLRGGKALAVFGGTLFALPQLDLVVSVAILFFIGFLFIEYDSWTVMLGLCGSLLFLLLTQADKWEFAYAACATLVLFTKQFHDLRPFPRHSGRLANWIKSRRKTA